MGIHSGGGSSGQGQDSPSRTPPPGIVVDIADGADDLISDMPRLEANAQGGSESLEGGRQSALTALRAGWRAHNGRADIPVELTSAVRPGGQRVDEPVAGVTESPSAATAPYL